MKRWFAFLLFALSLLSADLYFVNIQHYRRGRESFLQILLPARVLQEMEGDWRVGSRRLQRKLAEYDMHEEFRKMMEEPGYRFRVQAGHEWLVMWAEPVECGAFRERREEEPEEEIEITSVKGFFQLLRALAGMELLIEDKGEILHFSLCGKSCGKRSVLVHVRENGEERLIIRLPVSLLKWVRDVTVEDEVGRELLKFWANIDEYLKNCEAELPLLYAREGQDEVLIVME